MPKSVRPISCTCTSCRSRREGVRAHRGRAAWIGLLGLLVVAVPLAAALPDGGPSGGLASPVDVQVAPAPLLVPPTVFITGERAGEVIDWHESDPGGLPNAGSLSSGIRLPVSGTGYYTYDPRTQREPGGLRTRWGTAHLVREIMALGEWWARAHPDATAIGIGDLSRRNGGTIDGHSSHQNGLDVDIRLPRRDGVRGPASPESYDRSLAQGIVDHVVGRGASLVLIGPSLDLTSPSGVLVRWPDHDDHLHIRFPA